MLSVPKRKPQRNLIVEYLGKNTERSLGVESRQDLRRKPYRLTLYRIFELISDRKNNVLYKNKASGVQFKLNSARQASRVTGISNTVFLYALKCRDEGKWVQVEQETFVRLAYLLEMLEPSLVDPEDPDRNPIRFSDVIENGDLKCGWQQLRELHERDAPTGQEILLSDIEETEKAKTPKEARVSKLPRMPESLRKSVKSLILRQLQNPDRGTIPTVPDQSSFSCHKLSELVRADMGDRTLLEYAEMLVDNDLATTTAAEKKALKPEHYASLFTGLQMILGGVFPSGQVYAVTMRILSHQLDAKGDITELLLLCKE